MLDSGLRRNDEEGCGNDEEECRNGGVGALDSRLLGNGGIVCCRFNQGIQ